MTWRYPRSSSLLPERDVLVLFLLFLDDQHTLKVRPWLGYTKSKSNLKLMTEAIQSSDVRTDRQDQK